jgi:hypothetical protein
MDILNSCIKVHTISKIEKEKSVKTSKGNLLVTVTNKNYHITDYVVYQDEIWRKTGSEGAGINYCMKIEGLNNKVIWINGEEFKNVEYIVKPTGYITL